MPDERPIILIGLMLSGKTTVGRILSNKLDSSFVDLDEAITENTGQSIPELFERGEDVFRATEERTARHILDEGVYGVIALGGGAFESRTTRERCLRDGFVVYLEAVPAPVDDAPSAASLETRAAELTSGSLSVTPLVELLGIAQRSHASGMLMIEAGGRRSFSLDRGELVFARSTLRSESLGQILADRGFVTHDELDHSLAVQAERGEGRPLCDSFRADDIDGPHRRSSGCLLHRPVAGPRDGLVVKCAHRGETCLRCPRSRRIGLHRRVQARLDLHA